MQTPVDVVVIGGGIAGMVAALECAKLGVTVTLVDDGTGGAVRTVAIGDVHGIDSGAESFTAEDAIGKLALELSVKTEVLHKRNTVLTTPMTSGELPEAVIAGIPGNPFSDQVARFAPHSKFRAYADRVMPLLKIGKVHGLAGLVQQRLGSRMLNGFTDPYCRAVYRLPAVDIDLDRIAPTLNSTLTSLGTLSGAALSLASEPAEQLRVVGGMQVLVDALRAQLENYAVTIDERHMVTIEHAEDHWVIADAEHNVLRARAVIAAVDPATVGWDRPVSVHPLVEERTIVTALVTTEPTSDATGALWSEHPELAGASLPATRSAHLHSQLEEQQQILQLTLKRTPDDLTDVLHEAANRLGLGSVELVESVTHSWPVLRPWVALGDPVAGDRVIDETESLEWTGQWVSGPGLARAASHAHDVAHRIRRKAIELRLSSNS